MPIDPYTHIPALQTSAILGPGMVMFDVMPSVTQDQQVRFFFVAWKFRQDRRTNHHLLRIYPSRRFALDIAVMMLAPDGVFQPLIGPLNKLRAACAIRE